MEGLLIKRAYRICSSVTRGVGELDMNQPEQKVAEIDERNPYLLLDVRDADDYEMCHIISGIFTVYLPYRTLSCKTTPAAHYSPNVRMLTYRYYRILSCKTKHIVTHSSGLAS